MIAEIIDRLISLLGPLATLSKERRELKDSALRAISNALDETKIYFRDRERGQPRNFDRENMLVKYWSAAAIPLRYFDPYLSDICNSKSDYWVSPDNYSDEQIEELGISLENVRQAYRKHLTHSAFNNSRRFL